jgi:heterodisulfide reductase subunit C
VTPKAVPLAAPKASPIEIEEIAGDLAQELTALSGTSPLSCYQCAKCSSGCPVAGRSDLRPHELVRLIHINQRGAVLASRFIWECTSCHTCITRCPQKVDIGAMNDVLREFSLRENAAASTAVPVFNQAFLAGVRKRGRVHELGLMAVFKLRTRRLLADMDKAPVMLTKGKLPLFGERMSGRREREGLFRRAAQGNRAARENRAARGDSAAHSDCAARSEHAARGATQGEKP